MSPTPPKHPESDLLRRAVSTVRSDGVTNAAIAQRFGWSRPSLTQALLPHTSAIYRSPPPGWRAALAELLQERAAEHLVVLADLHPDSAAADEVRALVERIRAVPQLTSA